MSILVTGGAGYIGSHTCIALLEAGHDIVVVDNLSNAKPACVQRVKEITGMEFPFYEADMQNTETMAQIFKAHAIDAVIHFAGFKAVGESVAKPLEYYTNNVAGTLSLCRMMQAYGVKKMVFSSSATVYGGHNPTPYAEHMPTGGCTNPYGQSKLMIEQILQDLNVACPDFGVSMLRYFNPIGAHESGMIGEDPNGIPNNLMPYITQVAVGKLPELSVYGNDYDTPDGTCIRDYIHVCDIARGHVLALDLLNRQPGLHIHNLGTGKGTSVLEMIQAFEKASGQKVPHRIVGRRAGDLPVCYASVEKAQKELGFEAAFGLERMCRDSWRWQSQNPNGL